MEVDPSVTATVEVAGAQVRIHGEHFDLRMSPDVAAVLARNIASVAEVARRNLHGGGRD